MLAGITRADEFAIEEPEAIELAKALDLVNSFYRVAVAEKTLAWLNLAQVAGMIYGPRLLALGIRRGSEREARRNNKAAPVPKPSPVAAPPTTEQMQARREEQDFGDVPDTFRPIFDFGRNGGGGIN